MTGVRVDWTTASFTEPGSIPETPPLPTTTGIPGRDPTPNTSLPPGNSSSGAPIYVFGRSQDEDISAAAHDVRSPTAHRQESLVTDQIATRPSHHDATILISEMTLSPRVPNRAVMKSTDADARGWQSQIQRSGKAALPGAAFRRLLWAGVRSNSHASCRTGMAVRHPPQRTKIPHPGSAEILPGGRAPDGRRRRVFDVDSRVRPADGSVTVAQLRQ